MIDRIQMMSLDINVLGLYVGPFFTMFRDLYACPKYSHRHSYAATPVDIISSFCRFVLNGFDPRVCTAHPCTYVKKLFTLSL